MNAVSIKRYNAMDVLHYTRDQVWDMDEGNTNPIITLVYPNGDEVTAPVRSTIYSWYFWHFHRLYPQVEFLPEYHLGNRELKEGVENMMMSAVLRATILTLLGDLNNPNEIDIEEICEQGMRGISNELNNDMAERTEAYITTADVEDLIELVDHAPIIEANRLAIWEAYEGMNVDKVLKKLYSVVENILFNDPDLSHNPIVIMLRQGQINAKQVMQGICHRGCVQEINSMIYPTAIFENYTEGVSDLCNSMQDSRSGTLAAVNQTKPLQTSEYTSRKFQLVAMYVQSFTEEYDCGTTQTIKFRVDEDNLKAIDGCYYIDVNGNKQIVFKEDTNLVGQVIRLRNPACCAHPDPSRICRTCFGLLSYSIPKGTNLGWASSTELCSGISQSVLSTKHLNFHALAKLITLCSTQEGNKYLNNIAKSEEIMFDKQWESRKDRLWVGIKTDSFVSLADALQMENVRELSEFKISELQTVGIYNGGTEFTDDVQWIQVGTMSNNSALTYDFLDYIRQDGHYEIVDSLNEVRVSLANWDFKRPFLRQGLRHENSLDFVNRLKFLFEGTSEDKKAQKKANAIGYARLMTATNPSQAVNMAHEVISSKLFYPVSMIGVLVRSLTVRDPNVGDYRLTNANQPFIIGKYSDIMKGRSLSGAMAYQSQRQTIYAIDTYMRDSVPDHPLDWMMLATGVK